MKLKSEKPSNASNTIHIDDLVQWRFVVASFEIITFLSLHQSRNFALNPREGLKVSAFKNAHTPEGLADRELYKLTRYLLHIANKDFTTLLHKAMNFLFCLPIAYLIS